LHPCTTDRKAADIQGQYELVMKWLHTYLDIHGAAGLEKGVYMHPDAFDAFISEAGTCQLARCNRTYCVL
jgi:hypothetical protein